MSVLRSFTSEQWYFIFVNFFFLVLEITTSVVLIVIVYRSLPKIIDLFSRFLLKSSDDD